MRDKPGSVVNEGKTDGRLLIERQQMPKCFALETTHADMVRGVRIAGRELNVLENRVGTKTRAPLEKKGAREADSERIIK